jgi:hypothetical protein
MTATRERSTGEVDMPQACILLYGAALAAPLVLFAILICTGLERRFELAAKERLLRGRTVEPQAAPAASLTLVAWARSTAISVRPRSRTAA